MLRSPGSPLKHSSSIHPRSVIARHCVRSSRVIARAGKPAELLGYNADLRVMCIEQPSTGVVSGGQSPIHRRVAVRACRHGDRGVGVCDRDRGAIANRRPPPPPFAPVANRQPPAAPAPAPSLRASRRRRQSMPPSVPSWPASSTQSIGWLRRPRRPTSSGDQGARRSSRVGAMMRRSPHSPRSPPPRRWRGGARAWLVAGAPGAS